MINNKFLYILTLSSIRTFSIKQIFIRYLLRLLLILGIGLISFILIISLYYNYLNVLINVFLVVIILLLQIRKYTPSGSVVYDIHEQNILYYSIISNEVSEKLISEIYERELWQPLFDFIVDKTFQEKAMQPEEMKRIGIFLEKSFNKEEYAKEITNYLGNKHKLYFDKSNLRIDSFNEEKGIYFASAEEEYDSCLKEYLQDKLELKIEESLVRING